MRKKSILFSLLVLFILVACRNNEEEATPLPTVAPTAELPDDLEQGGSSDAPTPTPRPEVIEPETAAPITVASVDPADIDWPPQVIYSSPLPGAEVTLDGAISVRFDQPMDQDSVESAFTVARAEGQAVSGDFSWPTGDTVVFTPKSDLQTKQLYRVTIEDSAEGQNGEKMVETVIFAVQAEGALAVSQVIPEDGTSGIETDAAITVLFNRPVVPLVSSGNQASLPQPLFFDPPVEGTGDWTSTSIYRFVPNEPLAGATTYQVTVDGNLEDVTGARLGTPFSWQFSTLNPDIVMVAPNDGEPLDVTETISVTFNMPMDQAATESAITLRGVDAPAVSLAYNWSENGRIVGVTPTSPLQLQTAYQLQVSGAAQSATGEASLGENRIFEFSTWPFPAVLEVQPERNSVAEVWQRGVYIQFVSPMNWETVEDRIVVEPEPNFVRYSFSDFNNSVTLDFPLELDTEYSITIPGDVTDQYGNPLGNSFSWQFQAPGRPPLVSFNLPPQVSQLSTSVETAVEIIHANVSEANVELYDMGLPLNLINRPYDIYDYTPAATPVGSWNIPFETRRNEVGLYTLPLANGGTLPTGVYLLKSRAPELSSDDRYWQNQSNLMIVGDTNIVVKEMFGNVHVWTTTLASGEPVAGRNLTLFNSQGVEIASAVSDDNGFASFPYQPIESYLDGVTVISNTPGQAGFGVANSRWNQNIGPWQFNLSGTTSDEAPTFAYIYTDRPIYRPGDTVFYKGIVRAANYGRYGLPEPQSLNLRLVFNNFFSGEGIDETITVDVGPDGTFNGEYVLPEDAATGTYQIFSDDQFVQAQINFTVAEYRAPEFLLALTPDEEEAVRGESMNVTLEASYFFGGPATDLPVEWTVYEQPYFLNVPGYSFTDSGDFYYTNTGQFGGGFGSNFVANGSGMTDANGQFVINLPADLLDDVEDGSRELTVEATVMDVSGFPVAGRTNVVYHAADLYVGVTPESYVSSAETDTAVNLITVDWDGSSIANQTVDVTFYEREWIPSRTNEYGQYYTAWEVEDTEVASEGVTTDGQGKARASFVPERGGNYLAVAEVRDGAGRTHLSSVSLYVTDSGQIGWQTDPAVRTMDLVTNQDEYRPGDTAQILVQSPFAEPVKAWLTIERGGLIEQRVITLNSSSDVLEIPIDSAYAPNVFVTVTAVKGVTPNNEENLYADIRLGMTELVVSPEELELDITLTPQEDSLQPGNTAVYDILVTDHAGNPVQADLSLALVDLAVLTLTDDNAIEIVDAFYYRQPMRSQMGAGLFISGEGLEVEIPTYQGGLGGGGGDFAAESAVGKVGDEEDDVRGDFPDTAFWEPHVITDENGRASIEIPLPDTLTTWRLSSKGATSETLVGQSEVDIVTSLPLLVRPVTPRFFTVGDVVQIGAVVHNNTEGALETAVSLQAEGLTLNDDAEQTITIAAGDSELIRWEVSADNTDFADLTFRAAGGDFSDATKPSFGVGDGNLIPIYKFTGQDVVGTSGELGEAGRRVEAILLPNGVDPEQGAVEVTLSASLAAAVLDSLQVQNNIEIDQACAHSISYRLMPNAATAKLVRDLNLSELEQALQPELDETIKDSINRLNELRKDDGGWGWCFSDESDTWISTNVMQSLLLAQAAGYQVDSDLLQRATEYLQGNLLEVRQLVEPREINLQAYMLYVLAEADVDVTANVDALFDEHRALLLPSSKAMMALAYERNGATGNNSDALLSDLNNDAVTSATGAHWESSASYLFFGLNDDIYETAVVINTLAQMEPNNPSLPSAVRWLMNARTAVSWPSMFDTSWSIVALNEWMAVTGELNADYDYSLLLNLQEVAEGQYTPANVADSDTIAVPLSGLLLDEPNFFEVGRSAGDGNLYYTMHLNSAIDANEIGAINRGFTVERVYYDAACDPEIEECAPIMEIEAGQKVRVVLNIIVDNNRVNVIVEDPIPAGATAIDPGLNTTSSFDGGSIAPAGAGDMYGYWGWWYFDRIEYRDEKVRFLSQYLPAGTYQYTYFMDTNIPGEYQVMPTFAFEDFTPEVNGRSDGMVFTIIE